MFFSVPQAVAKPILHIGEYYTEAMPGLALFTNPQDSILMRVYWFDSKNKGYGNYKDFIAAKPTFGASAPDDSYHRLDWSIDDKRVTFEWGMTPAGFDARFKATGPVKIITWFAKAWPGSQPKIALNKDGYGLSVGDYNLDLTANGVLKKPAGDNDQPNQKVDWGQETSIAPIRFQVTPANPGLIECDYRDAGKVGPIAGMDSERDNEVTIFLDRAASAYESHRTTAQGDWGDFMSPIQNELGHSRVYSPDTEGISEIVSRNWCLPDGQVLFCWDSFFNGLLASIENPEAGREVVRAVLNGQLPNGLVPNFSGRGWGVSADRSQPPVGSLCVWKMYQRDPDIAFLKEVFPKLLKWHNWWFTARDGNNDGLLEWGSETGVLQNAKFESGLDDSPMFDTATMSGTHMMVDSVDLNALWAMDAEYLAKIAQVLGDHDEAAKLGDEVVHMVNQVNGSLWNPEVGAYCYRYWTPRLARHSVPLAQLVSSADGPGLHGDYFTGRNFDHLVYSRQDADINFNWTGTSPQTSLGKEDYSVRWTANISAKQSADYIFKTYADDGVRVWIDGKQIIDDWKVHGTNETDSAPVSLEAGATHEIKIEYFQAAGDAVCRLEVEQLDKDSPAETFYNRLSPLNFYPMAAGVPTPNQAKAMRDILFRSKKFEGDYMCPTIERDDPAFPQQGYWRGTIWGPTNYLLYQGLRRYCTDAERNEFAKKSVALFMKNWNADGTCHENFNAMTGEGRSDPHYTWGALLCLIGIEDLCDIEPNGKLRLNGASGVHIEIKNFRLGGKTFDLRVEPNRAELRLNGHLFFDAKGKAAEMGMSAAS